MTPPFHQFCIDYLASDEGRSLTNPDRFKEFQVTRERLESIVGTAYIKGMTHGPALDEATKPFQPKTP